MPNLQAGDTEVIIKQQMIKKDKYNGYSQMIDAQNIHFEQNLEELRS